MGDPSLVVNIGPVDHEFSMPDIPFSILIPAYNEEAIVRQVVDGLRLKYQSAEIIVVDDGSSDGTFNTLEGADATYLGTNEIVVMERPGERCAKQPKTT